jgi:hypothetical protein
MLKMVVLLISYAITPVVVGHGVMPMGVLLVAPIWQMGLAWGAIVVAIAGSVLLRAGSVGQLCSYLASTILLYGAWLANVLYFRHGNAPSEQNMALESMVLLSLPFQVATAWVTFLLLARIRRTLTRRSAPLRE